jgi:benzoylformate decarboxylase
MRGRQVFMDSLVAHGTTHIFGNPGTTESPLLDCLRDYPQIGYVMHLHEGVALGAASYYAQASGKTGIVNLHVAPGLGNALGMLHGALRQNSPIIVTAGQQDTRLRLSDPVLGHDLVAMAAPLTKWSVQVERADEMALILRRAFKIAHDGPPGPVFVALPIDVMEQETAIGALPAGPLWRAPRPEPEAMAAIAKLVLGAKSPAIVCGDEVARAGASKELVALAELIGAQVWFEGIRQHSAFPTWHSHARLGLPLDAASIARQLEGSDLVLLVGGPFFEEVWFSPGSPFPKGCKVVQIEAYPQRLAYNFPLAAGVAGDVKTALAALAEIVEAGASKPFNAAAKSAGTRMKEQKIAEVAAQLERAKKSWDRIPASMARVMAEIKAALPNGAIVVDESITASIDLARTLEFKAPGDFYGARGGGIGQGLAGALGVAVAQLDRPVVCISGDGSAMYSIQALWTAAHHDLRVVFIILANREYRVLKHNIDVYRARFGIKSNAPYPHMELSHPELGFVELAKGMGVAGACAKQPDEIAPALKAAFAAGKPYLVEIVIEGKR